MTPHSDRVTVRAISLKVRALYLAEDGKHLEAQRAVALYDAACLAWKSDRQGVRLALIEARFLRRAARRQRHAVLA